MFAVLRGQYAVYINLRDAVTGLRRLFIRRVVLDLISVKNNKIRPHAFPQQTSVLQIQP